MTKKIDLFSINILGIEELNNNLSLLQSELKATNSLIDKYNKIIKEYETATNAGVSVTDKQTDAFLDAKLALPGLIEDKKRLIAETNEFKNAIENEATAQKNALIEIENAKRAEAEAAKKQAEIIRKQEAEARRQAAEARKQEAAAAKKQADEENQIQKDTVAQIEKSRRAQEASAKKQVEAEQNLQNNLSRQVKSIEDLSAKTNALIAVRKKLDMTTEDGKREFDELTKVIVKNQNQLKEYDSQIGNYQRNVGNYSSAVSGMFSAWAKGAALAAGATKAIEFAIDIIGDKTAGVEQAFNRLNNPAALDQLRTATKGTVSDLNLMTAAVKADNFKIPMDALAKGLQFAQKQAKATGEDVDYLVNSFVMGIGRKSALILDNLGISSVELREKLRGIGTESATTGQIAEAVMEIIDERMKQFGDDTDLAAEKAGRLQAAFQNIIDQSKKNIANFLAPLAESGTEALRVIVEYSSAIWAFIKAIGAATAGIYAYIVAGKLKLLLSKDNRVAMVQETLATYQQAVANGKATASTHLLAAAKLLLTGNVKAATTAMKAFGASLMANPLGLILGTITAVTTALILFKEESKSTADITEDLRKSTDNYSNGVKKLNSDIKQYEELQEKAKTQAGLNEEEHQKLNNIMENMMQTVPGLKAEFDEYGNALLVNIEHVKNYAEETQATYKSILESDLKISEERSKNLQKELEEQKKVLNTGIITRKYHGGPLGEYLSPNSYATGEFEATDEEIESARVKFKELLAESEGLNNQIIETKNAIAGITKTLNEDTTPATSKRTVELIDSEISALKKEQKELSATSSEWEKFNKQIIALEKERESITGSTKKEKNTAEKRAKIIQDNAKYILKLQQANEDMELKQQADSIEKRLAQQELSSKRELQQAEDVYKDQQEILKKAKIAESPEMAEAYENQRTNILLQGEKNRLDILQSYTISQLAEYQSRLDIQSEFGKKETELVNGIIEKKKADRDKSLENDIQSIENRYNFEKDIADKTITDAADRNSKILKLTLEEQQTKYDLIKKEIEARKLAGEITEQEYENYINQLKELYDSIQKTTDEIAKDSKRTTPLANLLGLDDENVELLKEKAIQLANDINDTISNLQLQNNQKWLENETKRIDESKDKELKSLENRKKQELISEETYERDKAEIEQKARDEKEAADREAFEKEKELKMKQATIEMALGIIRIWAQSGIDIIKGSILTAALVATTATQIAAINAQQFAKGGKISEERLPNGKIRVRPNIKTLSNGDNVLATVKTGEVILNEKQQKMLGGAATFKSIGVPGFASGGRVGMFDTYPSAPIPESSIARFAKQGLKNNITDAEFIKLIDQKMNTKIESLQVYVTETDISSTNNTIKTTVEQAVLL